MNNQNTSPPFPRINCSLAPSLPLSLASLLLLALLRSLSVSHHVQVVQNGACASSEDTRSYDRHVQSIICTRYAQSPIGLFVLFTLAIF